MGRASALRLEQVVASRSQEELEVAALLAAQRLGFRYLAFLGSFPQHGAPREVRFDNLPEGLTTGVSCSVRVARAQSSITSFALAHGSSQAARHIAAALPDCQLVACAIHFAAARIVPPCPDRALPTRRLGNGLLSERERQCLFESARGKTTAAIAQALQISERTVAFHLANARRKLDAANSRHAVTKALSLRLIVAG